jgi:hypothetical protein
MLLFILTYTVFGLLLVCVVGSLPRALKVQVANIDVRHSR